MASKKSKVLAIAFCAAVMSGIYVNPVLAKDGASIASGEYNVQDGTGIVQMPIEDEVGNKVGEVQINNIASQNDLKKGDKAVLDEVWAEADERRDADDKLATEISQEHLTNVEQQEQLDDHSQQLDAVRGEISEEHRVNGEQQEQLDDHSQQLDAVRGEISEEHRVNGEQQEQLDDHSQQLDAVRGEISEEHRVNGEQQEQLDDHSQQLDAVRGEISEEHRVNGEQQEQLDDHSQQLDAVRGEISEEHRVNGEQQEQLDDHSQQLDAVRGEISEEHRVNGEQNEILADHQEQLDDHSQQLDEVRGEISSEIRDRTEADEKLQQSIDIQREVIGAGSTDELKGAYSGTNYIKDANNMAEADVILDREISNVNSRVDGIENRVDGLEDRIDKVGAMSAAIANLRTMGYDPAAPTEVAVGVGQYRDETGMALGLFHYPNRDFMLSLSVSTSGDEYMGGIGATWKFGRKSPEKVAEIKKAQAEADARRAEEQKLAKAEEMKKAAKEAKVQAQMERHAKMLAEQEAQA